ncbi:MAG: hypothetical protein VX938_10550, partial [Myxococcota bacterium]|nr:hypothetical protein [Myxococcota bacterium]
AFIAVAYDAANLMASRVEALNQNGHEARLALSTALSETREYSGVTGPISLLEGGAVGRKAIMLTIDGEEIRGRRTEQEEAELRHGRGGRRRN